jgi:uncharacterized protein YdeI (YjbR/CyaY-like superfamily)
MILYEVEQVAFRRITTMNKPSPEVDAFIARSAPFARPILEKLRRLFHQACPDIEETMKWGFPHFVYKGIVGGMAAFKQHMAFGFWKAKLMNDPHGLLKDGDATISMSRLTDISQLPPDKIMLGYIREAVALNETGTKLPPRKKPTQAKPKAPAFFLAALRKNKKALATFEALSPSHQREYIEWLAEAKQPATRDKRLATSLEWLAEGKPRNWKYMKK